VREAENNQCPGKDKLKRKCLSFRRKAVNQRTIVKGRKAAGSPSNTVSPGMRPTSTPSFILIYPAIWPQYTNVTDRQDRIGQTDRTTVRQHRANRFINGRPKTEEDSNRWKHRVRMCIDHFLHFHQTRSARLSSSTESHSWFTQQHSTSIDWLS